MKFKLLNFVPARRIKRERLERELDLLASINSIHYKVNKIEELLIAKKGKK